MRLLVLDLNQAGIKKFRVTDPHTALSKLGNIDVEFGGEIFDTNSSMDCDAVFVHSSVSTNPMIMAKLKKFAKNKKLIVDVDDYWNVPTHHYLYHMFKKNDFAKNIINLLKTADLVTTTTKYLKTELSAYNKNVVVIPNSIDPNESQFIHNNIHSERFRLGMATGSSHMEDIKLMRSVLNKMVTKDKNNVQFVLAGFDVKIKDASGKIRSSYKDTIWKKYEEVLTNNFSECSPEYTAFLRAAIPNKEYEKIENETYRRIWTRPIQQYGTVYNEMDVSVAPLRLNKFNSLKSELKVIESGFHGIPIVCSNLNMYADVIEHGVNGFLVDEKKSHKDFMKYINVLYNDANMRKEMGINLHETVNKRFNLLENTKIREETYLKLLQ